VQDVLQIKNLTKTFGGLVAVSELNTTVTNDNIHALIGPNGSGKTTTINMISGVLSANGGQVIYEGKDILGLTTDHAARMGVVRTFQNIKLFGSLSVLENAMVGGHAFTGTGMMGSLFHPGKRREEERLLRQRAEEALSYVGLYSARDESVQNLPYGKMKMLELARALMSQPKLLLLDEPAAGLNPTERMELMDMLQKIFKNGIKLFLVEHNMDVVMKLCNRITVLSFGIKIAEGSPNEIQNDPDVIKAYLGQRYKKV